MAPPKDHDPGRIRNEAFFKALYGASEGAVRAEVRTIPWVPRLGNSTLTVTTRFGIDQKLAAVSDELQRLPPRFHKYLTPPAGAFLWRQIAGTDRLSVHAFGAAVDINTQFTNYWRWDNAAAGGDIPYRNQIPIEIVEVFEKYCFIWGGRWHHYDTMHFEYRPEFLPNCRN
nr:M15 family metallopeptidase [Acuticoccus kalidii]